MEHDFKYITGLRDHRILVIGGTSGIGLSVAEAAVEHGAVVIISGSNPAKLHNALDHLATTFKTPFQPPRQSNNKPVATGYICNLSDTTSLEHHLQTLLAAATDHGVQRLDHIIFTAGNDITIPSLHSVSVEQILAMQTVRVLAPIILAKLLPQYVKISSSSSLTLTGGTQAMKPSKEWSVMAGIISAISGLVRGFAVDLQPVRVNGVIPGAVKSTAVDEMDPVVLEEKMARFREMTLTRSVGTPREVAEAYLYCMKSGYATGTLIVVDGGKLLT